MDKYLLQQGMISAFEKAKELRVIHFIFSSILACSSLMISKWLSLELSLFFIFVLRGIQFFLNFKSKEWISKGRSWHQLNLFYNSLGELPPAGVNQEIMISFKKFTTPSNPKYFDNKEELGPARLVENVSESAFYTASNASYYKKYLTWFVFFWAVILAYFIANGFGSLGSLEGKTILFTITSFLIFGEMASRLIELYRLEQKCHRLANDGLKLLEKKSNIDQVTSKDFAFKYILILYSTAPLPTWVHNIRKESIQSAWKLDEYLKPN